MLKNLTEVAKLYKTRKAFRKGNYAAYIAAQKLNLLDVVCEHMVRLGSLSTRCIYVFEFTKTKVAYIGLTFNDKKRYLEHTCIKGPVYNYIINRHHIGFKFKILYDYTDPKTAASLEKITIEDYKSRGWKLLNRATAGALGGNIRKWNEESCRIEALKYTCRSGFRKGAAGAYNAALRGGFLQKICKDMEYQCKPPGYWTEENCRKEALKYSCRSDFKKGASRACVLAREGNFFETICAHMPKNKSKRQPSK